MLRFSLHLETSEELLSTFTICQDILAKITQFGVYTFFLTSSADKFHWTEMIQVVACQYGKTLTNEQIIQWMEYKGELFEKKSIYCSKAN